MQAPTKLNLKVYQGSTFSEVIRWESNTKIYKTISNITQAAPCVITAPNHGCPEGWRIKITNVLGMVDINSTDTYNIATSITNDTLTLNDINSVGYKAYISGGILEYNAPVVLTGYTARMQIRPTISSDTLIDEYTTTNNKIMLDTSKNVILILADAITTAAYSFNAAVYSLEMIAPDGTVTPLVTGNISLIKEITR